jgi:AraC-like DNA-binding protein
MSVDSLGRFFGLLPFAVNLFHPDGTSAFVNDAFVNMLRLDGRDFPIVPEQIVGSYNVLEDPAVVDSGRLPAWLSVFAGSTVHFPNIAQPIDQIRANHRLVGLDTVGFYQDITAFAVSGRSDKVEFVASVMITRRVVRGRPEIARAADYLASHWREPFDAAAAAAIAGFSQTHFAREFKKATGATPRDYHFNCRLEKLKERLGDPALSVTQAFAACGLDYSGRQARAFRERLGVTPSQFRRRQLAGSTAPADQ